MSEGEAKAPSYQNILRNESQNKVLILFGLTTAYLIWMSVFFENENNPDNDVMKQYNYKYLYSVQPVDTKFVCPYGEDNILQGIELEKCKRGCYGQGVGNKHLHAVILELLRNVYLRPIVLHMLENRAHDWDNSRKLTQTSGVCHCVNDFSTMQAMHDVVPFLYNKEVPRATENRELAFKSIMQHSYNEAVNNNSNAKKLLFVMHMLHYLDGVDIYIDVGDTAPATANLSTYSHVYDSVDGLHLTTFNNDAQKVQTVIKDVIGKINPSHWTSLLMQDYNNIQGTSRVYKPEEKKECLDNLKDDDKAFVKALLPFCARYGIPITATESVGILHSPTLLCCAVALLVLHLGTTLHYNTNSEAKNMKYATSALLLLMFVLTIITCSLNAQKVQDWIDPIDASQKDANLQQANVHGGWHYWTIYVTISLAILVLLKTAYTLASEKEDHSSWIDCIVEDLCLIFASIYLCIYSLSVQFYGNVVLLYLVTVLVGTCGIAFHMQRQNEIMLHNVEMHEKQESQEQYKQMLGFFTRDVKFGLILFTLWVLYIFWSLPSMDENPVITDTRVRVLSLMSFTFVVAIFLLIDLYYGVMTPKQAEYADKRDMQWWIVAVFTIILQMVLFKPTLFL